MLLSSIDSGCETIRGGMTKFAVLGSPIAHSKSPAIHMAAFAELGLSHEYTRFEVSDQLAEFLNAAPADFLGFSVTMPLKEQALALSSSIDEAARDAGAVNTLLRTSSGWSGFNTDVPGLQASVQGLTSGSISILGSGATARSALVAMRGKSVGIWARDGQKLHRLSENFQAKQLDLETALSADLVISTLRTGALDDLVGPQSRPGVLFDVTYDPWPTVAASRFQRAISGLELLVNQALFQQRIFSSGNPLQALEGEQHVLTAMRRAVGLAE